MPAQAIAPGAGVVGGVLGQIASQGDQNQAAADIAAAQAAYGNVNVPTIQEQQWNLANEQNAGSLQPQAEGTYTMGQNAMAGIQTNPQYAAAQQAALASLQQQGQGGLTAQERANLINSNQQIAGQTNAQNNAIQQQMAARGMGGSGTQLAAQLSNSQGSANQASNNANAINAQAQNAALQATAQGGNLASQLQGQQFGQQAAIAQAQNAINQFNTANTQNVAGYNTQAANQAQAANLANAQNISNTNTGLSNQQQAHNTGLYQTQFGNQMQQAAGLAGTDQAAAGYMGNQAAQVAGAFSGAGAGLGTMGAALANYGGSSNPGVSSSAMGQSGSSANSGNNFGAPSLSMPQNTGTSQSPFSLGYAQGGQVSLDSDSDTKGMPSSNPTRNAAMDMQNKASQDAFMKSLAQASAANMQRAQQTQTPPQSPAMGRLSMPMNGSPAYSDGGNVLDANARNHIASKNFAGPDRSYPIEDANHARNALSRVAQNGSPELQAQVRAKVHAKYPSIGQCEGGMQHYYGGADIQPLTPTVPMPSQPTPDQLQAAEQAYTSTPSYAATPPPMNVKQQTMAGMQKPWAPSTPAMFSGLPGAVNPTSNMRSPVYPTSNSPDNVSTGEEATGNDMTSTIAKLSAQLAAHKAVKKMNDLNNTPPPTQESDAAVVHDGPTMQGDDTQGLAFGGAIPPRMHRPPNTLMNARVPLVPMPMMGNSPLQGPVPGEMSPQQKAQIMMSQRKMSLGGDLNDHYKSGGMVPAMVSPGEKYLNPTEVEAVEKKKVSPKQVGKEIPGKAKVKGDSPKNDTVPAKLETGGIVIPRSVMDCDGDDAIMNFVKGVLAHKKAGK